jgi:GAF domain-containing protein
MTKNYAGKAFGITGVYQPEQPRPFSPSDFAELLELQRRSMQGLLTAIATRDELRRAEFRTLADTTIAVALKVRLQQLRN